ncbi:MAG TPA: hypothetical protein DCS87_16655 [Rheinheimera sp.]|nr:hypothetical protein [Rheinheimera sp.]
MTTKRYQLSQLAQQHVQAIKRYTVENYSNSQWQHYRTHLLAAFQMLADTPPRPSLRRHRPECALFPSQPAHRVLYSARRSDSNYKTSPQFTTMITGC